MRIDSGHPASRKTIGPAGRLLLTAAMTAWTAGGAAGQESPLPGAPDPSEVSETLRRLMEEVEQSEVQGVQPAEEESAEGGAGGESEAGEADADGQTGAEAPTRQPNGVFRGEVTVDEFDLVDLHVTNENLGTVLRLLSMQSRRNIVASRDVFGPVTADLYGVTFYEALDAILHINGFGYREEGNFIFVHTLEELDQIAEATRVRESRVIELDFLNSIDAARFAEPLLSTDGSITTPEMAPVFDIPSNGPTGRDEYANEARLVIHDYAENIEEIEALIRRLDTRPTQVLVEATILQAAINEANAFGIDFSLIGDLDFIDVLSPLSAANSLIEGVGQRIVGDETVGVAFPDDGEGRAVSSSVGNTAGPASLKVGIVDEDVAVFMRVLDAVTDVTVISNPKVLTLNRQPARVLVGTRVGYLNTTTTETSTTQSVQFLDTGTQLHIRPFVTTDNLIRMEVKPQVSTASLRDSTTATGQVVTIPDEDTTELVTNLLVRDGQTVVLGGLFSEDTTYTRRQVPVLGDIPLIGAAFRGQDDTILRQEIIFMITPTVVDDAVLTLESERAEDYVEHTRVGMREGLLPWSRERQVGQLLIEAEELARQGDKHRAILKVQRALALAPHSPDARVIRERITGEGVAWPTRSVLEDIFMRESEDPDHGDGPADDGPGGDAPTGEEVTAVPVDSEG